MVIIDDRKSNGTVLIVAIAFIPLINGLKTKMDLLYCKRKLPRSIIVPLFMRSSIIRER